MLVRLKCRDFVFDTIVDVLVPTREDDAEGRRRVDLLLRGLRELGWTEGRNINFVYRWAGGDPARAKADAAELASEKPDVIIANSTMAIMHTERSFPNSNQVIAGA